MGTVFLCVTLFCLLASLKEKFLLKPEREERRQRKKVKWQVSLSRPGGRVVRSWSQARPLTISLPSETELPPTMEAGVSILMSKGLSLRAGLYWKVDLG